MFPTRYQVSAHIGIVFRRIYTENVSVVFVPVNYTICNPRKLTVIPFVMNNRSNSAKSDNKRSYLARVQSKLHERLLLDRAVQVSHRLGLGGGGDPAISASHPSQPPRSQYFPGVLRHRGGTSLAVKNRRVNSLARKSAQRQSGTRGHSCLTCCRRCA
jgi:hypothetical protein